MPSRKEERDALRRQRMAMEQRESSSGRTRLILGYAAAGVLAAAVVAGLIAVIASGDGDGAEGERNPAAHIDPTTGVTLGLEPDERDGAELPDIQVGDLRASAQEAGCELREDLPEEGNGHIPPEAPDPDYRTNPPTSGDHDPEPFADGAFLETPPLRNVIHSLEHGRIAIHYQPDLDEEDQLLLKGTVSHYRDFLILFPNPDIPFQVAAAAWQQLLGCPQFSERALDALRNFTDTYVDRGPELVGPGEPGP